MYKKLFFILTWLVVGSLSLEAQSPEEAILDNINTETDALKLAKLYNELSMLYLYKDTQKAIEYTKTSLSLSKGLDDFNPYVTALSNLATAHCYKGDYLQAKEIAENGLVESIERKSLEGRILLLEVLGRCAKSINDYEISLSYYNKALDLILTQASINSEVLIPVYGNMAGLYVLLEQLDTAIDYYHRVEKLLVGDNHRLMIAYVNLAYTYIQKKDWVQGEQYARLALKIAHETGSNQFIGYAHNMLGERFYQEYQENNNQVNLDKAYGHFAQSLKSLEGLDKNSLYLQGLLNYGRAQVALKQGLAGIETLNQTLDLASQLQNNTMIVEAHYSLTQAHFLLGHQDESASHLKLYKTLINKQYKSNLDNKVSAMLVKFDTKNKEKELLFARIRNESLEKDAQITLYTGVVIAVVALSVIIILVIVNMSNKAKSTIYRHLSRTDTLTALNNRMAMSEVMLGSVVQAKLSGEVYTVILADIDNFKSINDTYGHRIGDVVLKSISKVLSNNIRASDTLARWGGEEFVILLPSTALEQGLLVAETLRGVVERNKCIDNGTEVAVTMSFGIAQFEVSDTLDQWIDHADTALYQAKDAGKNRVAAFQ